MNVVNEDNNEGNHDCGDKKLHDKDVLLNNGNNLQSNLKNFEKEKYSIYDRARNNNKFIYYFANIQSIT